MYELPPGHIVRGVLTIGLCRDCVHLCHMGHLLETSSSREHVVSLSSGGSESCGLARGGAASVQIELPSRLEVFSDSSEVRGMAARSQEAGGLSTSRRSIRGYKVGYSAGSSLCVVS